uniref:Uncharacterized protein n=1 Tax=Chromera velia CCMP2878 TaxID=1169474 RepID=A0A0G4F1F3_9ALVE|eukprot:Cvel_2632.t1-p1 / transcript=Cvel_2632.t1 / gene=Cvel_2632 / organism=Chromera_velia_CCMP2878 / gene_product=hypothetical protein / transcript_product=hypothetical protein / location=Cvel_scaffold104:61643-66378(-) / protein_length=748 / sequence_SO=supercontig / SO=protein_coding / is_pseudo=false
MAMRMRDFHSQWFVEHLIPKLASHQLFKGKAGELLSEGPYRWGDHEDLLTGIMTCGRHLKNKELVHYLEALQKLTIKLMAVEGTANGRDAAAAGMRNATTAASSLRSPQQSLVGEEGGGMGMGGMQGRERWRETPPGGRGGGERDRMEEDFPHSSPGPGGMGGRFLQEGNDRRGSPANFEQQEREGRGEMGMWGGGGYQNGHPRSLLPPDVDAPSQRDGHSSGRSDHSGYSQPDRSRGGRFPLRDRNGEQREWDRGRGRGSDIDRYSDRNRQSDSDTERSLPNGLRRENVTVIQRDDYDWLVNQVTGKRRGGDFLDPFSLEIDEASRLGIREKLQFNVVLFIAKLPYPFDSPTATVQKVCLSTLKRDIFRRVPVQEVASAVWETGVELSVGVTMGPRKGWQAASVIAGPAADENRPQREITLSHSADTLEFALVNAFDGAMTVIQKTWPSETGARLIEASRLSVRGGSVRSESRGSQERGGENGGFRARNGRPPLSSPGRASERLVLRPSPNTVTRSLGDHEGPFSPSLSVRGPGPPSNKFVSKSDGSVKTCLGPGDRSRLPPRSPGIPPRSPDPPRSPALSQQPRGSRETLSPPQPRERISPSEATVLFGLSDQMIKAELRRAEFPTPWAAANCAVIGWILPRAEHRPESAWTLEIDNAPLQDWLLRAMKGFEKSGIRAVFCWRRQEAQHHFMSTKVIWPPAGGGGRGGEHELFSQEKETLDLCLSCLIREVLNAWRNKRGGGGSEA